MPSLALSRDSVRRVDQIAMDRFGMSGLVLMENAGRGCAESIAAIIREITVGEMATVTPSPQLPVTILCGKGNNAGDGYVIARHLQLLGIAVTLVPLAAIDDLSGDARVNAEIAQKSGIPIVSEPAAEELQRLLFTSGVIVDCMLGTGAQGTPREPYANAIRLANHADAIRVAVDIPSGLDCDSGQCAANAKGEADAGTVFHADHTLTLVARKLGFNRSPQSSSLGKIQVISIGIPQRLLDEIAISPVKA